MGIDWETILDAEGADMADAYEDMVFDAMEKMEMTWPYYKEQPCVAQDGYGRCIPFPAVQAAGTGTDQGFDPDDYGMIPVDEAYDISPALDPLPDMYLDSTAELNTINDRIFNLLLSIQGFVVDSGAVNDSHGLWKLGRDMCALAGFPIELGCDAKRSDAESRLDRYRHAQQTVRCADVAYPGANWAAPGRDMTYLREKLDELDEEIQKYDETLRGCGQ